MQRRILAVWRYVGWNCVRPVFNVMMWVGMWNILDLWVYPHDYVGVKLRDVLFVLLGSVGAFIP